ncbi:PRC-barrel domain containing protein [Flavihumibacter sp. R14]|nr:PRC-barrel domain containing protein [Flavihumibacter soli]
MASNTNEYSHLSELGNSKYEIASGESDIRNWLVKNENGNILGEVQDLIFDSKLRKVVFIVLDLDRNELNLKERRVLLPLEYAEVNEAYKNVIYRGLMPNELAALPTYEKGKISKNSLDLTMSTFLASMGNDAPAAQRVAADRPAAVRNEFREADAVQVERAPVKQSETGEVFYTVIGVFDQPRQTRDSVEYLLNHGFLRDEITVSTRHDEYEHEQNNRGETEITHFFRALFNNDEEARRYAGAAARGSVVTVDVTSPQRAEKAAEILDQHGSVDMSSTLDSPGDNSVSGTKKANSRIFERRAGR